MKPPTNKQLSEWWAAQPKGDRTCTRCGVTRPHYYVQPQHPYYAGGAEGVALCGDCIDAANRQAAADRKAELDAMPRCEIAGCNRRATWKVGGERVGMCGHHKARALKAANRQAAGAGWLGLGWQPDRDTLLDLAK